MGKRVFGYNSDGSINPAEAAAVRFIFAKNEEYCKHPPRELVERIIEIAMSHGETLEYEDAEKQVSYSSILEYIAREANEKFCIETDFGTQIK